MVVEKKDDKSKVRKVTCPECDAEVELDVDGDGVCGTCGLPVGAVIKKRRVERAVERLRQREEAESKGTKKPSTWDL